MIEKKFIALIAFVFTCTLALANDIALITETTLPYSSQKWFSSGYGNTLQGDKIKEGWDEGLRITALAYTKKGWFVTMSENSGIGMQTYKTDTSWPADWIKQKWDDGYRITAVSCSDAHWVVVMSKGGTLDNAPQTYKHCSTSDIGSFIKKRWDQGYYITSAAHNGSQWTIVMTKTDHYTSQGYFFEDASKLIVNKVQTELWDQGKRLQMIELCGGQFFVVYCTYASNNGRVQNFYINHSDVNSYIKQRWDNKEYISYVGGNSGNVTNSSSSQPTRQPSEPTQNPAQNQSVCTFYFSNNQRLDVTFENNALIFKAYDNGTRKYTFRANQCAKSEMDGLYYFYDSSLDEKQTYLSFLVVDIPRFSVGGQIKGADIYHIYDERSEHYQDNKNKLSNILSKYFKLSFKPLSH